MRTKTRARSRPTTDLPMSTTEDNQNCCRQVSTSLASEHDYDLVALSRPNKISRNGCASSPRSSEHVVSMMNKTLSYPAFVPYIPLNQPTFMISTYPPQTMADWVVQGPLNHVEYRAYAVSRFRERRSRHKRSHVSGSPSCSAAVHASLDHQIGSAKRSDQALVKGQESLGTHKSKKKERPPKGRDWLTLIPASPLILSPVSDCRHCGAKKFKHETSNLCCSDGDITLLQMTIPEELQEMLLNPCSSDPRNFRVMIRAYNNHLAFTSLGVKYDQKLAQRNQGIYTFRIQGQVYHWINSLMPNEEGPKNLQFYCHDTDYELANRIANCPELDEKTLESLLAVLKDNPYARFFRSLSGARDLQECKIILRHNPTSNSKTYDRPSVSQVAVLLAADETSGEISHRDIRVYEHSGESRTIQYYFGCYDPLQYPLIYTSGQCGWHQGILKNGVKKHKKRPCILKKNADLSASNFSDADELLGSEEQVAGSGDEDSSFVSIREYYSYRFQIRPNDESHLLRYGRLFQQYCVDMYVKVETQRLDFFRAKSKQDQCRQEFLQGIVDAVNSEENEASKIGQRIVLPGSFIGGPRYMRKKYVDAMTLVQKFGKPDIFLTITCNPNWPEIRTQLLPIELAQDRPDLTARVFHSKVEDLKHEILRKHVFGEVRAYTYVIEYQKRGLPHAHFLLILKNKHKLYDPAEYDRIVSAEIPDKIKHPGLYKSVVQHMLHGPCGDLNPDNVCMRKNKTCKNMYPKEFCNETLGSSDSYPRYRRRDDGTRVKVRGAWLDNRWVVPYSPYLVALLDCHINVEICTSIKAVKYIYKYICKGSDRILFQLTDSSSEPTTFDEINNFVSARWISPPEAMWRIYRFPMNEMKPPVISLPLHLENYQPISFSNHANLANVLNDPKHLKTMLTQFFYMNKVDQTAMNLRCTYADFPTHFVWVASKKTWKPRNKGEAVGRIVTAHPSEGERFYLRMLLSHVPSPTSYEDLMTVDGHIASSFRESALLRGLLQADNSQHLCLEEASVFQLPYELRRLFASILAFSTPNDPKELFVTFEGSMSEDFSKDLNICPAEVRRKVLEQIASFLESMGKQLQDYITFPSDQPYTSFEDLSKELRAEGSIVVSEDDLRLKYMLNTKQKEIFNVVTSTVYNNKSAAYFVDGPGGTGKTFLYRALLAELRSKGFYALATATSGIAASILPGGRTAHSRFKIPLDTTEFTTCRVSKQTALGHLIRECRLIIWDEAPMAKRTAIESLDDLLQDLMSNTDLFGGKVLLFGGDFRQILPVVQQGSKSDTLDACLINSPLWPNIVKLHLTENMRAKTDPYFASLLMSIGEGIGNVDDSGPVRLPDQCTIPSTDDDSNDLLKLINFTYPNFDRCSYHGLTENKAILSTKNQFVQEINDLLIDKFPGAPITYSSFDETTDPNLQGQYEDIINTLSPNGLPPHKLLLKENAPIILLRNLDPYEGLCNGTRLTCKALKRNVIHAQISLGEFAGKTVFLHRIPLQPTNNDNYPVPYKRTQFPIRLCFAMTINKAQGQTLDSVGVYLKEPVFSHGQLYVALSRAKSISLVKVLIRRGLLTDCDPSITKNIVYKEVLNT